MAPGLNTVVAVRVGDSHPVLRVTPVGSGALIGFRVVEGTGVGRWLSLNKTPPEVEELALSTDGITAAGIAEIGTLLHVVSGKERVAHVAYCD